MNTEEHIPEFGLKRENEERRDGGCGVVFDPKTQKYAVGKQTANGLFRLFSGGIDTNEDIKEGVLREVVEESGFISLINQCLVQRSWVMTQQARGVCVIDNHNP